MVPLCDFLVIARYTQKPSTESRARTKIGDEHERFNPPLVGTVGIILCISLELTRDFDC